MTDLTTSPGLRADHHALMLSAMAAVFWGSNFEATRVALQTLSPWSAAAGRFVLAALATVIWMRMAEGAGIRALRRNGPALVFLGLVGVAGFNAALFLGMQSASPVTAALIMATSPLSTNLIEAFFSHQRPSARALTGMGVSLIGVALTVGAFSGTEFVIGDGLILAGSLCWALYTVGCRRWVHDASPLETSAWTMVFGTIALLVAAFVFESPVSAYATANAAAWGATVWMALAGSTLAFAFWQTGIRVRGPGATSILFNLVPVSALLIAAGFGRMPEASQLLGVALAIGGVLWASHPKPAV